LKGATMTPISDAVLWVNQETREVMVTSREWGTPKDGDRIGRGSWTDPIGAAHSQWHRMDDQQRLQLMLETAADLARHGFDINKTLRAMVEIPEFNLWSGTP
jgi:hypothetical protein